MAKNNNQPLLKSGSTGSDVKKMQQELINAGYNVGKTGADGIYGANTTAAVKQYQKDHGLTVDGIAGQNTMVSLYDNGGGSSNKALNTLAGGAVAGANLATGSNKVNNKVNIDGGAAGGLNTLAGGAVAGANIAGGNNGGGTKGNGGVKPNLPELPKNTDNGGTKGNGGVKPNLPELPKNTDNGGTADNGGTTDNGGTPAPAEPETPAEPAAPPPAFSHVPSETVQAANKVLADQWNSMPGAYQSQWQDEINKYMDQYINRDPFSYDFNSDALYQMYKDQYIQQGQMAMMDTMGQAAAMTGGYGNSYAQTVGQQVYNQQLAQLNNIIPELYQMAYGKYRDEGQDMLNAYNMYMDRENMDYGRYQDDLSNWWRETEYLTGRADTEYERDYNSQWDSYTSEYNSYWDNYEKEYQEGRDAIDDQQEYRDWLTGAIGSGYEPTDEDLAKAGMTKEQAAALKNAYTTGSKGNGNGNGNGPAEWDNGKLTTSQVKMLQQALGVTADGKWGDESFNAAGGMTADEALKAYQRGELGTKPGGPDNPTGGLNDARKDAIYDWLEGVLTNPNLSASFDPNKLINGSSFLTSDEERAYAREIISYLSTIR